MMEKRKGMGRDTQAKTASDSDILPVHPCVSVTTLKHLRRKGVLAKVFEGFFFLELGHKSLGGTAINSST